jgi:AcrR family transcriptional regulator
MFTTQPEPKTPPGASDRGRGRPTIVNPQRVLEETLALWKERGYEQTGWREISEVTGISVRTLIRRFGDRSTIPWVGVPAAVTRLRASLANAPADATLADALRHAIVASVSQDEGVVSVSPDWISLVSEVPQLRAAASVANAPWTEAVADYISQRHPEAPRAICRALASSYRAAAFAALVEWSRADTTDTPDRAVVDMLRWLDIRIPSSVPRAHR